MFALMHRKEEGWLEFHTAFEFFIGPRKSDFTRLVESRQVAENPLIPHATRSAVRRKSAQLVVKACDSCISASSEIAPPAGTTIRGRGGGCDVALRRFEQFRMFADQPQRHDCHVVHPALLICFFLN